MAQNDFSISIKAALDVAKSKIQISKDLLLLQAQIAKLKVIATLNRGASKAQLNKDLTAVQGQLKAVKVGASLNKNTSRSQVNKDLNEISKNIKTIEVKVKAKTTSKDIAADISGKLSTNGISAELNQSSNAVQQIGGGLKTVIARFLEWKTIATAVNGVVSLIQGALHDLRNLDTELVEISKTSDLTATALENLGKTSFGTANRYGREAADYLEAVKEMSRAGYGDNAPALAELSLMAQSAGDLNAETANQYLVATDAAYGYRGSIEGLTAVLDGQNQVTNRNAVDLEKLASATKIVASQAAQAGIPINELTAAIGTISAVTQQEGSVTGRAFKAILMNLQQVTGELEDGEIIDAESLSKSEAACAALGVSLKEVRDGIVALRDPMEVLHDLSVAFNSLSADDSRRSNLLQSVAGKNRSNQLAALLGNWELYEKMLSDYAAGSGSALREALKTADSWEGRLAQLSNTWDSYVSNLVNSKWIKGSVTAIEQVIAAFDRLNQTVGAVPPAMTALFGALTVLDKKFGLTQIFNGQTGKIDLQGRLFGIDFTAVKRQKAYFNEAEKAIAAWNNAVANGTTDIDLFQNSLVQGNKNLKVYLQNTTDGSATLEGYKSALHAAGVSTDALRLKTVLLNSAIGLGIGLLIQFAANGITELMTRTQKAADSAQETANKIQSMTDSYSDFVRQYEQLGDNASWDTASIETAAQLQSDILDLLVGQSAEMDTLLSKIDLANGGYERQKQILEEIAVQQARDNAGTLSNNLAAQGNLLSSKKSFINDFSGFGYFPGDSEFAQYLAKNGFGSNNQSGVGSGRFSFGDFDFTNAEQALAYYDRLNGAVNALAAAYGPVAIAQSSFYNALLKERDGLSAVAESYREAFDSYWNNDAFIAVADALKDTTITSAADLEAFKNTLVDSADGISDYEQRLLDAADRAFPEFAQSAQSASSGILGIAQATSQIVSDFSTSISSVQSNLNLLDQAAQQLTETGSMTAATFASLQENNLLQYLTQTAQGLEINKTALLNNAEAARISAIQALQNAAAQDILSLSTGDTQAISVTAQAAIGSLGGSMINAGNNAVTAAGMVASFNAEVFKAAAAMGATIDSAEIQAQANAIVNSYRNIAASIAAVTIDTGKYTGATASAGNAARGAAGGVNDLTNALNDEKSALQQVKDELQQQQNTLRIYGKAAISQIDKRIDAIKAEQKAQENLYDSQIKALEDKKKALQAANNEEDRAIKLAELQEALARAQSSKTVRTYKDGQGFTWTTDQTAVDEAQNNLDDQQRDWNREDAISAIESEIESIEKLKDAYSEQVQSRIDELTALKDQYNETMGLIGTSWADYQMMLEAEALFEGMTFEQMAAYHTGYKDSVIQNMMELSEVESQLTEVQDRLTNATNNTSGATGGGSGTGLADSFTQATTAADSLLEEIRALAIENETLKGREAELTDTVAALTEGTSAHFHALDELSQVQSEIAGNTDLLNQKSAEYVEAVGAETDTTNEQKQAQIDKLAELLAAYELDYTTISELLEVHLQNLQGVCDSSTAVYQSMQAAVDLFGQQCTARFNEISSAATSMAATVESAAMRTVKALLSAQTAAGGSVSGSAPRAYASGSPSIRTSGTAMVDDAGREIVVRPNRGRYTTLEVGDGVVRNGLTNTLLSAAINPDKMISDRVKNYFENNPTQIVTANAHKGDTNVNVGGITMNEVNDLDTFSRVIERNIGTVMAQALGKRS